MRGWLAEIKRRVDLHGALVIRGQKLDPRQLLAFTSLFGEPAGNALLEYTVPGFPEIYVISNKLVDGRPIHAVAVVTKQAFTYVFDRVTGKPVWPIEERPVSKGTAPGE